MPRDRGALGARERRALLVGVAIIVPTLAIGRAVPAWRAWDADTRAEVAALHMEVRRARERLASLESGLDADPDERAWVSRSREVPGAVAELTDYLAGIATVTAVQLRTATVRGDTAFVGGAARIELHLALAADLRTLLAFLREVAVGPRMLPVRSLSIAQPDPSAREGRPERLAVELVLEAYAVQERLTP